MLIKIEGGWWCVRNLISCIHENSSHLLLPCLYLTTIKKEGVQFT